MSRQKAINEKYKDCIYDSQDKGTWRQQVTNCTETTCSLYEYRPLDVESAQKQREKKIELMSEEEREAYNRRSENSAKILKESRG